MKRRHFLSIIFVATAWAGWAGAYLLPASKVTRKAGAALAKNTGAQVVLEGRIRPGGKPPAANGVVRWDFQNGAGVDIEAKDGRRGQWQTGAPARNEQGLLPDLVALQVMEFLFARGELQPLLQAYRVDLGRQRLALFGDRVVHVIGADKPTLAVAQVWIDQETFDVLRVMVPNGGQTTDIQLTEWAGPISDGRFPHRIVISTGRRWMQRLELTSHRVRGGR